MDFGLGDVRFYLNHMEQTREQLSRQPRALPALIISLVVESIFDFKYQGYRLEGYDPNAAISAPVALL